MQKASAKIWTRFTVHIFSDDNHYTTSDYNFTKNRYRHNYFINILFDIYFQLDYIRMG